MVSWEEKGGLHGKDREEPELHSARALHPIAERELPYLRPSRRPADQCYKSRIRPPGLPRWQRPHRRQDVNRGREQKGAKPSGHPARIQADGIACPPLVTP